MYRPRDDVTGEELVEEGTEWRFLEARPGDHLLCPFECEMCGFRRIRGLCPQEGNTKDGELLDFMRRANLDAFWSRESGTIAANLRSFMEQTKLGERHEFDMFDCPGPFGPHYDSGIRAALSVLYKSQQPGRHEEKVKFSTARKARSVHSNLYKASAHGGGSHLVMRSDKKSSFLSSSPIDLIVS